MIILDTVLCNHQRSSSSSAFLLLSLLFLVTIIAINVIPMHIIIVNITPTNKVLAKSTNNEWEVIKKKHA